MLYLDSSALIKRYVPEAGSNALDARLVAERPENAYSSVITFAEILTVLARRAREKFDTVGHSFLLRRDFEWEWTNTFGHVGLGNNVLALIAKLVDKHPLKGSDAIHLASAIWLRDQIGANSGSDPKELLFATSDRQLKTAASKLAFKVFDPEDN